MGAECLTFFVHINSHSSALAVSNIDWRFARAYLAMGRPILYCSEFSPPVRAVWLTAKAIGLNLDSRTVNIYAGEHLKPEYLKMNPQHTVPTLDDNGRIIWDSHAICTYLIEKYAKDDCLYPKDLYIRARINQRLHFDTGVLFTKARASSEAIFIKSAHVFPVEAIDEIHSAYNFMETFLRSDLFLVGNRMTVADLCCLATISTMQIPAPIQQENHPKLFNWFQRMCELPFYEEVNGRHVQAFREFVDAKMNTNRLANEIVMNS